MAIILISPQKTQRRFLIVIAIAVLSALLVIAIILLWPLLLKVKDRLITAPPQTVSNLPDIKINFDIIDSNQVATLLPFKDIKAEFSYIAENQAGKQVSGTVSAINQGEALQILTGQGLKVSNLQAISVGRNEPFTPY